MIEDTISLADAMSRMPICYNKKSEQNKYTAASKRIIIKNSNELKILSFIEHIDNITKANEIKLRLV